MSENNTTFTLDDLLFASIPSSARCMVIEASVTIERTVDTMLSRFLDIDPINSKSFGMTSAALSFNHKINLLTDLNIIDKTEKDVLIKFAEIRNLFAHNAVIIQFWNCFEQNGNQIKNFLLKKYGQQKSKFDFEEENCKMLFELLYNDVKEVCRSLFHKMMSKAQVEGKTTGKLIYHDNLIARIEALAETDSDFRKKMIQINEEATAGLSDKK